MALHGPCAGLRRKLRRGMDEDEIIRTYFAPLAANTAGAFDLTDDAATISSPPETDLVVTTDIVISGVHFLKDDPPADIGAKALGVNLSDLAGKGAEPLAYTLSAGLPRPVSQDWLAGLSEGMAAMQAAHGIGLIGGDTTRSPDAIMLSITAFGTVPCGGMVRRGTARPGDLIYVSGTIGDSALGLLLASNDARSQSWTLDAEARAFLLSRYRRPQPRTRLAATIRNVASAGMDISDGLVIDAGRLCRASGVSATIHADRVPLSPAAQACLVADSDCLETILTGGDDYELLMTVAPENSKALAQAAGKAGIPLHHIGGIICASDQTGDSAVRVIGSDGKPLSLSRPGYTHFA